MTAERWDDVPAPTDGDAPVHDGIHWGPFASNGSTRPDGAADPLTPIDWISIRDGDVFDVIEPGLFHPGRWINIAAGTKQGKTDLVLYAAVFHSLGVDPFDQVPTQHRCVLYLDAENGGMELWDRLHHSFGLDIAQLDSIPTVIAPPKLGTVEGAAAAFATIENYAADIVIIDGVNGVLDGAEKDDAPWRDLYENFITPAKIRGLAVCTLDNVGHEAKHRSRGSSVKQDKADAEGLLKRAADGSVTITYRTRRSSDIPESVTFGRTGEKDNPTDPVRYTRVGTIIPPGMIDLARVLDDLDVDPDAGRKIIRDALAAAKERDPDNQAKYGARNDLFGPAQRYRRNRRANPGDGF